ncbi:M24 family metallopeptidase [Hominifimenecus sp. rT4P-3]|uniref:M24 family metallopeptidase n=1 Tax=Hominifimenecus sp. rT4P-3 TaxID=3242979 RepID=UPI003DA23004
MYKFEKCLPPILAKRDHKTMIGRIQAAMQKQGFEYLVLTHVQDTFYATGYMPLMPSAVTLVPAEGDAILIVSTLESEAAYSLTPDEVEVREVRSWVFIDDGTEASRDEKGTIVDPDGAAGIVADILTSRTLQGKVGINTGIVSKRFWDYLTSKIPESHFADCAQMMLDVRIFKTPWEIDMLRIAAQEAEKVYEMMAEDIKPGMPAWKIDALYVYYSSKLNLEHGILSRRHVFLTSQGEYYGLSGMPRGYILQKGDIIKLDAGFRYMEHSSDIARTFAVGGDADDKVQELYETLYKAFRIGVDMLAPGVKISDLYWAVRNEVEKSPLIPKYPRGNMGHSIGCGFHAEEYPTISRDRGEMTFEPGMVFCVETPYSGVANAAVCGGFNIEDTFAVTETGHEAFTHAPDTILWAK